MAATNARKKTYPNLTCSMVLGLFLNEETLIGRIGLIYLTNSPFQSHNSLDSKVFSIAVVQMTGLQISRLRAHKMGEFKCNSLVIAAAFGRL